MYYLVLTLFAAAVAALDQRTKLLASKYLIGETIVLIPGHLQLHYITNDGMALSMLSGRRWFFVLMTAVFFALVIYVVAKKIIYKKPELWCVAAIAGGAAGNLIDRIATGKVIDMICVPWFSTFNVADIFITCGAVVLIAYIIFKDKEFLADKPKAAEEAPHDDTAGS